MPLYEYRCCHCGDFEALAGLSERGLPRLCPRCGAVATRKISSPHLPSRQARIFDGEEQSRHEPQLKSKKPAASRGGLAAGRPWMLGH